MNRITLIALCLFMIPAHAEDDGASVILSSVVKSEKCENTEAMKTLFELSLSQEYTGTAQIQYLAEANELSFFNCPKQFLIALSSLNETEQAKVLNRFGIVHPPWEIAEVLEKLKEDTELSKFIENKLNGFFKIKKP